MGGQIANKQNLFNLVRNQQSENIIALAPSLRLGNIKRQHNIKC